MKVTYKSNCLLANGSLNSSQCCVHCQTSQDRSSSSEQFGIDPALNDSVTGNVRRPSPDPSLEADGVVIDDLEVERTSTLLTRRTSGWRAHSPTAEHCRFGQFILDLKYKKIKKLFLSYDIIPFFSTLQFVENSNIAHNLIFPMKFHKLFCFFQHYSKSIKFQKPILNNKLCQHLPDISETTTNVCFS